MMVVSTVIALWLSWDHGAVFGHGQEPYLKDVVIRRGLIMQDS